MTVVLSGNRYGKAETRLLRVVRHAERHDVTDLNVSVALSGDFADAHLAGDNSNVLPTDSQRNAVHAFAKEHGVGQIEDFALRLARHFVDSQPPVHRARVHIDEYLWERVAQTGHSFARSGREVRTTQVTCSRPEEASPHGRGDGGDAWVVSGLRDLVLLNTTGSRFRGYAVDRYTTLAETTDRILATAVTARWRHAAADGDWASSYAEVRGLLVGAFAETFSDSLQQTLYAMGRRVLEHCPRIAEVRLSLPNRHHLPVDLTPFGLEDGNEVFHVADRPYGLVEGEVVRDGAPAAGLAW